MPLRITLDLSDRDLRYFKRMMAQARAGARERDESEIRSGTLELMERLREGELSDFIRTRLAKLETMLHMLEDEEWKLSGTDRRNIVEALAYFADPEDLIPDRIPGLGYLDDAIMIELVSQELQHDIEAYEDFCDFRRSEEAQRGKQREEEREEWLAPRRRQLHARMRRRRARRRVARRRTTGRSPFALW